MTLLPALPPEGSTAWYEHYTGLHNVAARAVLSATQNGGGTWPDRPTDDPGITVLWIRIVAGSADPAAATPPAVNGAYTGDVVIGA